MTSWIEAIGFLGSLFTVLTYSMKEMLWLRVAALLSCLAFVTYGTLIGSLPLILMELTLLPINAWRLIELIRPRLTQN
ncbi:Cyclic nucleotide-binding protein (fragment) [Mesorhizobium metallidurans STM 2683]|uniref:Cyclic nucleotide-binding protein n=1 Tax=Mesorhizobium metallidurans STM 2683 TaxID=1297569 RepID=M5ET10_9HYPH